MDDGVDFFFSQQPFHQGLVADIAVNEPEVDVGGQTCQVGPIAGVGKGVQHHQSVLGVPAGPVVDKVGADEAGPAGDQQAAHGFSSSIISRRQIRQCRPWRPKSRQVEVLSSTLKAGRRAGVG